jgi:hypothetical protein
METPTMMPTMVMSAHRGSAARMDEVCMRLAFELLGANLQRE